METVAAAARLMPEHVWANSGRSALSGAQKFKAVKYLVVRGIVIIWNSVKERKA